MDTIAKTVSKSRAKTRTILLNALAEFLASIIFTSLYFIFISRYFSEEFGSSIVVLFFTIGVAFFAAIFIPFHTYRIHIIPFVSLISALRKRDPMVLVHKVPSQILGAFLGVLIFNAINMRTIKVDIESLQMIPLSDPGLTILLNTVAAALLCYGFYLIRILFKAKRLSGTIYLSLYFMVLFAATGLFSSVSALNPFGYLFYDLLQNQTILNQSFLFVIVNHFLAPIIGVFLVFYYIKPKVMYQNK